MLGFPWVADGITAGESSAISGVRGLMDEDPELAKEVLDLWWVPDDMPTVEQYALVDLRRSSQKRSGIGVASHRATVHGAAFSTARRIRPERLVVIGIGPGWAQ